MGSGRAERGSGPRCARNDQAAYGGFAAVSLVSAGLKPSQDSSLALGMTEWGAESCGEEALLAALRNTTPPTRGLRRPPLWSPRLNLRPHPPPPPPHHHPPP